MLACIACSKRFNGGMEEDASTTPRSPASREAIKNLTSQIKDMALKASGSYRYGKPSNLSRERQLLRCMMESELAGSESATPRGGGGGGAWNVLTSTKGDFLRSSNSSSNGTPKFDNTSEPMEEDEEEDQEGKEWVSHVEPGVIITLISLKEGQNQLKRIRFSRELFNKTEAQLWWTENSEKVFELYNVRPNEKRECGDLPGSHDEERGANVEESGSDDSPSAPPSQNILPCSSTTSYCRDADRSDDLQSSNDKCSMNSAANSSEQEQEEEEWVEEDEPGVYITIHTSKTGANEVKRVRFSREKFSEMQARFWWEANRHRIQEQYVDGHAM
ncbi:hypothetical protein KI387_018696 [Taxus chinensis]|uniref:BRX domain-containing protein n=1 Tax=Taxus chinensis TaxID=29808 RepID=A0AA38LDK8_TAXCH|nr:hypothetical protein KI387_018696 [Taxus chinensis]